MNSPSYINSIEFKEYWQYDLFDLLKNSFHSEYVITYTFAR